MSNMMGKAIAAAGQFSVTYGEAMLKGVKPEQFARLAVGKDGKPVQSNHPAWAMGHLAMYSSRCMDLMGLPQGVTAKPAGWEELFKNGTECKDDPSGTIYPPMEQISKHFLDGYRAVLAALPSVPDEVLNRPNPMEGRMKELLPTVGACVAFLMTGHPMSHLGQVSAWRRFMGLGSAM
jgi:hypothetical protein